MLNRKLIIDLFRRRFEDPKRDTDGIFLMPVEQAFSVTGRGTVAIGTVERGTLTKGMPVRILGFGTQFSSHCSDIQIFRKSVASVEAGQNCGLLLRGVSVEALDRGMVVVNKDAPGSAPVNIGNHYKIRGYALTSGEGGRSKPIPNNYIQQMFANQWDMACCLRLEDGTDFVMPGDEFQAYAILRKPMYLDVGQTFTVRENQISAVTGIVTETLPPFDENLPGFNFKYQRMKMEGRKK